MRPYPTGRIQFGTLTKCLEKSDDLVTINMISIGKITLYFLHNFNCSTNLLANIWHPKLVYSSLLLGIWSMINIPLTFICLLTSDPCWTTGQ